MKAISRIVFGLLAIAICGCVGVMVLASAARAQTAPPKPLCLPSMDSGGSLTASPLYTGASKNGAWVWWVCYLDAFSPQFPQAMQVAWPPSPKRPTR